MTLTKEVDKMDEKVYQEELREIKARKKSGLPIYVWFIILLIVLLILSFILKSGILLQITAGIFLLAIAVFIIFQLVDSIRMIFKEGESIGKYVLWTIIILLIPFFGALAYWFLKK